GDVVVVDIGGTTAEGYCSDETRTYLVGGDPDPEFWAYYAVLQRAQEAACAAIKPGVSCESIDAAAREVIAAAGYGEYFVHRRRLRRLVRPPYGPRHRLGGPRGPLPGGRQHPTAGTGHDLLRGARHLPAGPARRADRGHLRLHRGRRRTAQPGAPRPRSAPLD